MAINFNLKHYSASETSTVVGKTANIAPSILGNQSEVGAQL
jgi:hypothetical protein